MASKKKPKKKVETVYHTELSPTDQARLADEVIAKATIQKRLALQKAMLSGNVDEIFKAQQIIASTNIPKRDEIQTKSLLMDPQGLTEGGYKAKVTNLSYEILRNMAKVPVIKAIIETRKEQVLAFCEPQRDKYSTGFVVRPKRNAGELSQAIEINTQQQKRIDYLVQFVMNCGDLNNTFHGDDFSAFTRKYIDDSLKLDQATAEVIYSKKGLPVEFLSTDASTYRIAETFGKENEEQFKKQLINGYLPHWVQVHQGVIQAEFYPWEMMVGIRNPQTSIYYNGYGRSELEDLMETVTSMLHADYYNSNYFRVGSNPKGILKVTGNVNTARLDDFKSQWQATLAGVKNSHKMAVIEADKMDFISTQQSNKDMEYSKYQEYLIKVACSIYKIDPSEIGFHLSGSTESKPMFEGNNQARLEYSKDKGLKPLLKQYAQWLNKWIISPLDPDYELAFVGMDEESAGAELESDIKSVQNWMTVNEVRTKRGLKPIEGGDIILNPIMMQQKMITTQGGDQSNMAVQNDQGDQQDYNDNEDPFKKALQNDIEKLLLTA